MGPRRRDSHHEGAERRAALRALDLIHLWRAPSLNRLSRFSERYIHPSARTSVKDHLIGAPETWIGCVNRLNDGMTRIPTTVSSRLALSDGAVGCRAGRVRVSVAN